MVRVKSLRTAALPAVLLLSALALSAAPALASDKSSTRPNVISVPSGPGSIQGLGESFEANLNSGSVRETVQLQVPPGTAGLTPSLALTYDSGFGNGPVGIGWALPLSSIQVQTEKGLPRYDGKDRYLLDGSELVEVSAGVYRLKVEGRFARVKRNGEEWRVELADGKVLRYGVSAAARVESTPGIFAWYLEEVADRWGNRIGYLYEKDQGQVYLSEVAYNLRTGAAQNRVVFEYQARPDPVNDCRQRFCVVSGRRLASVSMFARGAQVRRYQLEYQEPNGLSLLSSVTQYGSDGQTALPSVRFWYSVAAVGTAVGIQGAPEWLPGPGRRDDELVDVDGDGFVDVLHAESGNGGSAHWYYLNQGGKQFGPAVSMARSPSVALGSNGVEVADLDGDGLPDLLAALGLGGSDWLYFPNRGQGQWESEVVFTNHPPLRLEDPNVRLLDLDHDKRVDLVQSTAVGLQWWRNRGDGSWDGAMAVGLPRTFPAAGFADPKLKLADMNGDRLVDLVYLLDGSVTYWPNLGWGEFGGPVEVANSPGVGSQNETQLMLADANGDGLTDLLWVAVRVPKIV